MSISKMNLKRKKIEENKNNLLLYTWLVGIDWMGAPEWWISEEKKYLYKYIFNWFNESMFIIGEY